MIKIERIPEEPLFDEPWTKEFITAYLKLGMVFVDAGARFGPYSRLAREKGASVIAFEPRPGGLRVLRELSSTLGDIEVSGLALFSCTDEKGYIARTEKRQPVFITENGQGRSTGSTTLDDYLAGRKVDLIKMDIEGSEYDALLGMAKTMQEHSPLLVIELHPSILQEIYKHTEGEVLALLEQRGYQWDVLGPTTALGAWKHIRAWKENSMNDVTVLVNTFDERAAQWPILCHGLRKYWPKNPWPVRFITNKLETPCGRPIKVGSNTNWSRSFLAALNHIQSPLVLVLLDDNWLTEPVDTTALREFASILLADQSIDCIRLCPSTEARRVYKRDGRLKVLNKNARYRLSCMASLWRVSNLKSLIKPNETPWQFEIEGSKRSRKLGDRYLAVRDFIHFRHVLPAHPDWDDLPVRKGRWTKAAHRYAEREHLHVDFSRQPSEG